MREHFSLNCRTHHKKDAESSVNEHDGKRSSLAYRRAGQYGIDGSGSPVLETGIKESFVDASSRSTLSRSDGGVEKAISKLMLAWRRTTVYPPICKADKVVRN
jgi:hypothetical protein